MYFFETKLRVRYGETDQMGYTYYGNYAQFFEVGRVETLRSLGFSYKQLEKEGIMLPVIDYHVKYIKPALYDELITIKTYIRETPSVKIKFDYEITDGQKQLLTTAETILVFLNKEKNRLCQPPKELLEKLQNYIK